MPKNDGGWFRGWGRGTTKYNGYCPNSTSIGIVWTLVMCESQWFGLASVIRRQFSGSATVSLLDDARFMRFVLQILLEIRMFICICSLSFTQTYTINSKKRLQTTWAQNKRRTITSREIYYYMFNPCNVTTLYLCNTVR